MIADWKDASKELPPERIRVLTCDSMGFMQTGFYGPESSVFGSDKKCWRSDEIGKEVEITIMYWDFFPECNITK